jgi:hypothetical protein
MAEPENFFLEDDDAESGGKANENDFQFEHTQEEDTSENFFLSGKDHSFAPSPNTATTNNNL